MGPRYSDDLDWQILSLTVSSYKIIKPIPVRISHIKEGCFLATCMGKRFTAEESSPGKSYDALKKTMVEFLETFSQKHPKDLSQQIQMNLMILRQYVEIKPPSLDAKGRKGPRGKPGRIPDREIISLTMDSSKITKAIPVQITPFSENFFLATCIQKKFSATGDDPEKACDNLRKSIVDFLETFSREKPRNLPQHIQLCLLDLCQYVEIKPPRVDANGWVNVKVALPINVDIILFYSPEYGYRLGYYLTANKHWKTIPHQDCEIKDVAFWKPIDEVPKELLERISCKAT